MPVEMAKEFMGKGPELIPFKVNGREYELTRDNLINFYMQFRQETGQVYAREEGFKINGVYTGPITDVKSDFDALQQLVESDPLSVKLMDYWYNTADLKYFKPNINKTSQILMNKDIATETEHYYPLNPEKAEKPGKKTGFAFREPPKRFNMFEDQGFLNPRKGPKGPLIVGSLFQDMEDMAEGVAEYSAYAPALRIAKTILTHRPTVKSWSEKGYDKIYDNLLRIIKNETELPNPKGWLETQILRTTRGATRAIFSLPNIRTPAIQISSTTMFAKDFEKADIIEGLKYAADYRNWEKVMKDIPWLWCRYYMDRGYRLIGGMAETAGLSLPMQGKLAAGQAVGIALKKADLAPFVVLYGTVRSEYNRVQSGKTKPDGLATKYWFDKDTKYGVDTEEGLQAIRKRFTVGKRGQQSYDKFDRSVSTSSHATLSKIFYLFRSFQEGAQNAGQETWDDYTHSEKTAEDKKIFARKSAAILSSYVVENILRDSVGWATVGLLSGSLKDSKKWYEWATDAVLGPLDMIPLVGNYIQGVLKQFTRTLAHQKPIYMGRIMEPLPLQVINTLATAPDNFAQSIGFFINGEPDKGKKSLIRAINATYEGLAVPAGVPVYEIKRFRKAIEGEEQPTSSRRRRRGRP
jgi:hypothetical protein